MDTRFSDKYVKLLLGTIPGQKHLEIQGICLKTWTDKSRDTTSKLTIKNIIQLLCCYFNVLRYCLKKQTASTTICSVPNVQSQLTPWIQKDKLKQANNTRQKFQVNDTWQKKKKEKKKTQARSVALLACGTHSNKVYPTLPQTNLTQPQ